MDESTAKAPRETGGILIGRSDDKDLLVTRALGPGPKAHHGASGFKRDGQFAQDELNKIFSATAGQEDYIGEWHSHPARCEASGVDIGSIAWISKNPQYLCESPVLIITVPARDGAWELLGYRWFGMKLVGCPIIVAG